MKSKIFIFLLIIYINFCFAHEQSFLNKSENTNSIKSVFENEKIYKFKEELKILSNYIENTQLLDNSNFELIFVGNETEIINKIFKNTFSNSKFLNNINNDTANFKNLLINNNINTFETHQNLQDKSYEISYKQDLIKYNFNSDISPLFQLCSYVTIGVTVVFSIFSIFWHIFYLRNQTPRRTLALKAFSAQSGLRFLNLGLTAYYLSYLSDNDNNNNTNQFVNVYVGTLITVFNILLTGLFWYPIMTLGNVQFILLIQPF